MGNKLEHEINCLAMAIVNHANEINAVDVETRQKNNDMCFDFAVEKIKEFLACSQDGKPKIVEINTLSTSPRMGGKTLALFAEFQKAIEKGKNALFVGLNYVAMSTENYQRLVNQSEIKTRSAQNIDSSGQTWAGDLTIIDEIHPEPNSHQPTLFSKEEINKCL